DCALNLKRITLAMLRYHAKHGVFPPSRSENHSWRVLLLPYFDEPELTALAEEIRLDEPWNSEHNSKFLSKCPDVYRCPTSVNSLKLPAEKTTYTVFVGSDGTKETLFDGSTVGKKPDDTKMHQFLVAERIDPVDWMVPDQEIPADKMTAILSGNSTTGLTKRCGSFHTGGANFGFRDGSVQFLSETILPQKLEALLYGTDELD
ncbi:MAG: DUF1559 domain-containing protein, partial [Thermoguttaceae bacterium]